MNETYRVNTKRIIFGILSEDDIRNMSVAKIYKTSKNIECGTVYDPRLGRIEGNATCMTCDKKPFQCGHFGHIELNTPVVHPLLYSQVIAFLNCVCFKCQALRIEPEELLTEPIVLEKDINLTKPDNVSELVARNSKSKFLKITKAKKMDICLSCSSPQPKISFQSKEKVITFIYPDKKKDKKEKISIVLSDREIRDILANISNADVLKMGFDPSDFHPRDLVMTCLPVAPLACRPYIISNGKKSDDDLSTQYIAIIKHNNSELGPIEIGKLKFCIATLFYNSDGVAKHTTNDKPVKCIGQRIKGKNGLCRGKLMGKRVNQSSRTVIGGDPTCRLNELIVPPQIAKILSVPMIVNKFNMKKCQKLLNDGKVKTLTRKGEKRKRIADIFLWKQTTPIEFGDTILRGESRLPVLNTDMKLLPADRLFRGDVEIPINYRERKPAVLNTGDVIERQLQDGDPVMFNRQPTLTKEGMMCFKVKIRKGKSFRFNLSTTGLFSGDFDSFNNICPVW